MAIIKVLENQNYNIFKRLNIFNLMNVLMDKV